MWHISKRKTFCELYKLFSRYPIQEICTGSSQKEGTEKAEPQKSEGVRRETEKGKASPPKKREVNK